MELQHPSVERLIIFTRYPEPGQTKTRLIPALGAEGAAQLQRQMTEHTVTWAKDWQANDPLSLEVRFAGGNLQQVQEWLGLEMAYHPQGEGHLGMRMAQGFAAAFAEGMQRVVTIGIDCPGLTAALVQQAFYALQAHDLVLGPATDGGYYLIGLRRFIPELFGYLPWGTATVLAETVAIAQTLNLTVAYLPPLTDIDRPEDLVLWPQGQNSGAPLQLDHL